MNSPRRPRAEPAASLSWLVAAASSANGASAAAGDARTVSCTDRGNSPQRSRTSERSRSRPVKPNRWSTAELVSLVTLPNASNTR